MTLEISHPDKVLWPQPGYTKADLARYYLAVADRMLPWLRDRPLTLLRHNAGVDKAGFLQKNLPDSAPAGVARHRVWTEASQREVAYALADEPDDLVWFAGQNAVEIHPWFSRIDRPERPDLLAFDLDPSGEEPPVWQAALWLRELLDELGLPTLVKTSGKRGLHLLVPLERRYDFGTLRGLALAVARLCADAHPDALTVEMRKADRHGRLLLDWSRAGGAQTLAAPWSPRASALGTVATPLDWDEVGPSLDPAAFTLETAPERPNPWAEPPAPVRLEAVVETLAERGYPPVDRSPRARTTK